MATENRRRSVGTPFDPRLGNAVVPEPRRRTGPRVGAGPSRPLGDGTDEDGPPTDGRPCYETRGRRPVAPPVNVDGGVGTPDNTRLPKAVDEVPSRPGGRRPRPPSCDKAEVAGHLRRPSPHKAF